MNCPIREKLYESVEIQIPNFKKRQVILAGGEPFIDYIFWYKDSSCIYISTDHGGSNINYFNIRNVDSLYLKRAISDTITLEGQDSKGQYWKDSKIGEISVGYSKVKEVKKNIFDKAIQSFIIIERKKE